MTVLLGIDPGLRFTGWGVVEVQGNRLRHVADGVIATDGDAKVPDRLRALHDALTALFGEHSPDEAAVEERLGLDDVVEAVGLREAVLVVLVVALVEPFCALRMRAMVEREWTRRERERTDDLSLLPAALSLALALLDRASVMDDGASRCIKPVE